MSRAFVAQGVIASVTSAKGLYGLKAATGHPILVLACRATFGTSGGAAPSQRLDAALRGFTTDPTSGTFTGKISPTDPDAAAANFTAFGDFSAEPTYPTDREYGRLITHPAGGYQRVVMPEMRIRVPVGHGIALVLNDAIDDSECVVEFDVIEL